METGGIGSDTPDAKPWWRVSLERTQLLQPGVTDGSGVVPAYHGDHNSMDWFKGKSTGNHGFYHQIYRGFL